MFFFRRKPYRTAVEDMGRTERLVWWGIRIAAIGMILNIIGIVVLGDGFMRIGNFGIFVWGVLIASVLLLILWFVHRFVFVRLF